MTSVLGDDVELTRLARAAWPERERVYAGHAPGFGVWVVDGPLYLLQLADHPRAREAAAALLAELAK